MAPLRILIADDHDLVRRGLPLADQLLSLLHRRAVQAELRRWIDLEPVESEPVTA